MQPTQIPQTSSAGSDTLDPQAKAMAMAIRQTESGGDFKAKGKSGEFGGYQFTEPTWDSYAKKYGISSKLSDATPEQQNEVAYRKIKEWKDSGMNPGQIASAWNAGEGEKDAYTGKFSNGQPSTGTNKYGVKFDVPAYATSVAKAYQSLKSGGQVQPDTTNPSSVDTTQPQFTEPQTAQGAVPTTEDKTLGQGLADIASQRGMQAGKAISDTASGKIGLFSGGLQTVGSVVGALGDVTSLALEKTPIVGSFMKGIEGVIGTGVKSFLGTDAGKAVAQSVSDFTKEHPELSDDIGAGVNIVSAIPILKGFGVVKNIALDTASMALKRTAEKSVIGDMSEVLTKTKAGKEILQNAPKLLDTAIKNRALPEIITEGGQRMWSTEKASKIMDDAISSVDDRLTAELEKGQTTRVADRLPIKSLEEQSVKKAIDESIDPSGIQNFFKNVLNVKYPDGFLTLDQINMEKRLVARKIKEAAFGDPLMTTNKALRKTFQTAVEDGAKSLGLEDVNAINKEMANLIKTQDMLDLINLKPVAEKGLGHQLMRSAATGIGSVTGGMIGQPVLGGMLGYGTTGYVEKKLGGIMGKGLTQNVLKRTAPGAVRQTAKGTIKAATKATAGLLTQKGIKGQAR